MADSEETTEQRRERWRSIGHLVRGRTRAVISEGRSHPESGAAYKTTTDETGSVTEHNTKDDRVDAVVRPKTVRALRVRGTGRITNAE